MSKDDVLDTARLINDIPFDHEADTDIESQFDSDMPNADDAENEVVDRAQNLDVTDNESPSSSPASFDENYSSIQTNKLAKYQYPLLHLAVLLYCPTPILIRLKWRKKLQLLLTLL